MPLHPKVEKEALLLLHRRLPQQKGSKSQVSCLQIKKKILIKLSIDHLFGKWWKKFTSFTCKGNTGSTDPLINQDFPISEIQRATEDFNNGLQDWLDTTLTTRKIMTNLFHYALSSKHESALDTLIQYKFMNLLDESLHEVTNLLRVVLPKAINSPPNLSSLQWTSLKISKP